ncbi:MAG TPA: hypothetical protein DD434_12870 [Bacteroidales bacterium]|nr:hypothetical protein [Bacteroidales bacterium]HBN06659.1 hypothetical protein [Bacteroidales bacterium]
MKKWILLILLVCFNIVESYSQISERNVKVNTEGLSKEYANKFKDISNIQTFVTAWNRNNIEYEVSLININVSYEDNVGLINVEIQYNPLKHFNIWKYKSHNDEMQMYGGVGISVLLQNEILNAITEYKFSVARKDWSLDKRIFEFINAVTLTKSNGDKAMFSGYNYQMSNGSFPFAFYKDVKLKINGKYMQAVTDNYNALNEYAFFNWGETIGMDGKRNASYYLSEFFKPTKEEQAILDAEKKLEEEKEALKRAEIRITQELLKNECLENLSKQINSGQKMSLELLYKNNCEIDKDKIICKEGNIEVPIGRIQSEHIRYIGGTDNLLNLLSMCDNKGNIIITVIDNKITIDSISQMFDCRAAEIFLFDEMKSRYFIDADYKLKTKFSVKQSEFSNELKVKVKNKKGKLNYSMSLFIYNATFYPYKKYKDDNLLNCIKKNITKPGVYYFIHNKDLGTISVKLFEENISEEFPCYKISLSQKFGNPEHTIIYYDKKL